MLWIWKKTLRIYKYFTHHVRMVWNHTSACVRGFDLSLGCQKAECLSDFTGKKIQKGPFQTQGLCVKSAQHFLHYVQKWKQRLSAACERVCLISQGFADTTARPPNYHKRSRYHLPKSSRACTHTHTHTCETATPQHFNKGRSLAIKF